MRIGKSKHPGRGFNLKLAPTTPITTLTPTSPTTQDIYKTARDTLFIALFALCTLSAPPTYAQASSDSNPANCEEVQDPDLKFQLEVCASHVGCGLVMGIHKACTKTKKFLNNLKGIMSRDDDAEKEAQAGDTSIFGKLKSFVGGIGKKEVTANQVFEAALTDQARSLQSTDTDWKDSALAVQKGIGKAGVQQITGTGTNGGASAYTYIGDVKDGMANGWGTQYWSTGQITRGQFKNNAISGPGEITLASGSRNLGTFQNGSLEGTGLALLSDGRTYKGQFSGNEWHGVGAVFRPDGTLIARGQYEKNTLLVGAVYDSQGNTLRNIDKPRDAQLARETAEQEFRAQLGTLTAPELFAKAEELSRSEKVKSEQLRQALQSRFPNHPLTSKMNEQIAQERAAQAEEARRRAESQRQQEIFAKQQAEQARQQAERDSIAAEQAKREKEARDLKALQEAAKFMEALGNIAQQRRQGNSGGSGNGVGGGDCPNGGNLVNGRCRFGVAQ